jgi:hypothetical protein
MKQLLPNAIDPSPVPLVIGVVGHRDPIASELERLRSAFRADLEGLLNALPHTPLLLLNGLASGMDSIAAEVFLEVVAAQQASNPGAPEHQLVAALPKPQQAYEEDFRLPEELATLRRLLASCTAVLDPSNCSELRGDVREGEVLPSPDCYGQQGIFLVRHCYLLAAFHNGVETMELGGTSQSVTMQKGAVHPLFLNVDEVIAAREPGALIEYNTPRHKNSYEGERLARVYWLESHNTDPSSNKPFVLSDLLALPRQIERINAAIADQPVLPPSWAPKPVEIWAKADQLAVNFKKHYWHSSLGLMIVCAAISLSLNDYPWKILGLLLIILVLVLFPLSQQGPKHEFITYRCLAESLTVQDFWSDLGVDRDAADLFHSQTHRDLSWIRTVLRARRVQLLARYSQGLPPLKITAGMVLNWMHGQVSWLNKTISNQRHIDQRLFWYSLYFFGGSLLLSFVSLTPVANASFKLASELLLAIAVALFTLRELQGYEESNARYLRSRDQFSRGLNAFNQALLTDPKEPKRLQRLRCALEAVGLEKLDELNDWVADQLKRIYKPGG